MLLARIQRPGPDKHQLKVPFSLITGKKRCLELVISLRASSIAGADAELKDVVSIPSHVPGIDMISRRATPVLYRRSADNSAITLFSQVNDVLSNWSIARDNKAGKHLMLNCDSLVLMAASNNDIASVVTP